ncbi:hypothetical protein [Bradyrhizobium sp. Ce-3]|uniref:hypothetical protein n=1 Tax=Bradyrhizobium sp. Ce-3 TaxID=2913970 RepID=UPI001FC88AC5|nr:hypothetical protein [Bradyrhizobium sp. Ce-3]GKQ53511.1 hypothetical protein BRSPCE3_43660 [Bradyrhizobium sp. Ce-3]
MSGTQRGSFLDNLREAVRENPLAGILIGGGALWLLVGNARVKSAASSVSEAVWPKADTGAPDTRPAPKFTNSPPTAPEMDVGSSQPLSDTLRDARSSASDAMSNAAGTIKDRLDEGVAYAQESFGKLGDKLPQSETIAQVQSSLSDLLERQPLLLGAMGVAVGAALGSALSASDLENEWVGEFSDGVKDDLKTRAGAVSRSMREASDTLRAEASDIGAETLERLQEAGKSGMNAVRENLSER